jgi:hypothetical protein
VLDICIQHYLAAEDVVRLWASSRALQQLCSSRISSALLLRSVEAVVQAEAAAAAATPNFSRIAPAEGNSMNAFEWLLRQQEPEVTTAMINQCSQQLLAIPRVPLAAAEALVRAGLRVQITPQQLVVRAYECFEGFEVWVAAFDAVEVPLQQWATDLPVELRLVCCRREVSNQVRPAAVVLQRTMVCYMLSGERGASNLAQPSAMHSRCPRSI